MRVQVPPAAPRLHVPNEPRYASGRPGAGFTITRSARRATRIGGHLGGEEKALACRRNRRRLRQDLREHGEDALLEPALWTDWDVI